MSDNRIEGYSRALFEIARAEGTLGLDVALGLADVLGLGRCGHLVAGGVVQFLLDLRGTTFEELLHRHRLFVGSIPHAGHAHARPVVSRIG